MAILSKPSRTYAAVEHNPDGLSSVGSAPYGHKREGVKTYRPRMSPLPRRSVYLADLCATAFAETHLKRPGMYDSNPGSSFSPLPPAFNISSRHRKDQVAAGQRAELDHILDPEYKSVSNYTMDDNQAGPSSRRKERTAGGLMHAAAAGLRSQSSMSNVRPGAGSSQGQHGQKGKSGLGGVYVDANGKVHDTEYDPFAGVSEVNRAKSRRRSAFGSDKHRSKTGSESGSSVSGSSSADNDQSRSAAASESVKDEEQLRRRRESERRRFEDVAGHAAMVRRRSVMSHRSGEGGRTTPSLRSTNDVDESVMSAVQNFHLDRLNGRSRSSQGSIHGGANGGSIHNRSPLSPTFGSSPFGPSSPLPPVADSDEHPVKSTETTMPPTQGVRGQRAGSVASYRPRAPSSSSAAMPPPPVPRSKVEIKEGGTRKITGFDAPATPSAQTISPRVNTLLAPSSARLSAGSRSRASSEASRETRVKPAERPREEIYPETPAQQKQREERERRKARSGTGASAYSRPAALPNINTGSGSRVLPEIQIVEDDDPRVIIPSDGRSTRLQTKWTQADHVIRPPFASGSQAPGGSGSIHSIPLGNSQKAPSEILDEGQGGYVPSRWAKGDKSLRVTEDDKEKYRPKEWGGKTGGLAGKPEEWR